MTLSVRARKSGCKPMLWIVVVLSGFIGFCSAQGRLPWLTNTADDDKSLLLDLLAYGSNSSSSTTMLVDLWSEILRVGDRSDIAATTREVDDLGRELVFGELTAKGVEQLLSVMGMMNGEPDDNDEDVFLDLGSGTAIAVLLVASILPNVKALGVEYAVARHEVALERLRLLTSSTSTTSAADNTNNPAAIGDRVTLINGNFLDASLVPSYKDVTVVFSNSIMFSEETEQGIKELITNDMLMPNLRFVVSGIQFHEECYQQHLDVSWGSDTFSLWACDMNMEQLDLIR